MLDDVEPAGQPQKPRRRPPSERAAVGVEDQVGDVGHGGHRGGAVPLESLEKLAAPPVVDVDDGATGPARLEEPGLGRKVLVHGAVVVQMVLGQVGEGGRGEVIAPTRCWSSAWDETHGAAVTPTGAGGPDRLRTGASGVVRAGERADRRRLTVGSEDSGQQLDSRGLAVGPVTRHGEVMGGMVSVGQGPRGGADLWTRRSGSPGGRGGARTAGPRRRPPASGRKPRPSTRRPARSSTETGSHQAESATTA